MPDPDFHDENQTPGAATRTPRVRAHHSPDAIYRDEEAEAWVEARASSIHGMGVFALRDIPADTLIGRYRGPVVQEDGMHVLWIQDEDGVDEYGIDGRNILRYLNHDHAANAIFDGDELYAERDIARGEEITIHYGDDWTDEDG